MFYKIIGGMIFVIFHRYGMTETGMILSNTYDSDREPGYVGIPLPGVSVRLAEESETGEQQKTIVECTNDNGTVVFTKYKDGCPKGIKCLTWTFSYKIFI